jgi:hypothetical protein
MQPRPYDLPTLVECLASSAELIATSRAELARLYSTLYEDGPCLEGAKEIIAVSQELLRQLDARFRQDRLNYPELEAT